MKIGSIEKKNETNVSRIQCMIGGSLIFIEVEAQYKDYLVDEVSDSFVLATMLPSMMAGEDIECDTISDDLYYHSSTILFLLSKVFHKPCIKIIPQNILHVDFNPTAVASGFSGGIDSLCTYVNHKGENCPKSYRLTHLTLFNSGAYGNDYEQTQKKFILDAHRAKSFADEENMPFVAVNTNIGTLYTHKDIFHYSLRSSLCLCTCVLALSKMFKYYFISGAGTIDEMKLTRYDQSYYSDSLLQLLSTHNTQIFMGETNMSRVEKTQLLADNPLAQKYLYVCAADIFNETGSEFKKDTAPNCSECLKCTRTMITLELLGKLEMFSNRFDIEKYKKCKNAVIQDVLNKRSYDHFAIGIYELMKANKWKIPYWRKVYGDIWGFWRRMRYKYYAK